jgi:hypothetical protein
MTLTVISIAEKVEIDYTAEYPLDTLKRTGQRVVTCDDGEGNKYAIDADALSVNIGDKISVEIR